MIALRSLSLAVVLAACSLPVMADEMPFQGSTSGSFSDALTAALLSFAGTNFGPGVTAGGNFELTDLGTFTINLSPSDTVHLGGTFDLTVTFIIPVGSGNPSYSAAVSGTINGSNANNVDINFDPNGQTVNFSSAADGYGSFFLTVDDLIGLNGSNTSFTRTLTGRISDAVFTPTTVPPDQVVPEPTSILLLFTVVMGAGVAMHRRRRIESIL